MISGVVLACSLCGVPPEEPAFTVQPRYVIVEDPSGACHDIYDRAAGAWIGCGRMSDTGCDDPDDEMGVMCEGSFVRSGAS